MSRIFIVGVISRILKVKQHMTAMEEVAETRQTNLPTSESNKTMQWSLRTNIGKWLPIWGQWKIPPNMSILVLKKRFFLSRPTLKLSQFSIVQWVSQHPSFFAKNNFGTRQKMLNNKNKYLTEWAEGVSITGITSASFESWLGLVHPFWVDCALLCPFLSRRFFLSLNQSMENPLMVLLMNLKRILADFRPKHGHNYHYKTFFQHITLTSLTVLLYPPVLEDSWG